MGLELIEVRVRQYRQPTPRPGEPFSAHVLHSEVSVAGGPKESIEKEE